MPLLFELCACEKNIYVCKKKQDTAGLLKMVDI